MQRTERDTGVSYSNVSFQKGGAICTFYPQRPLTGTQLNTEESIIAAGSISIGTLRKTHL